MQIESIQGIPEVEREALIAQAQRGMALLDRATPNWEERVWIDEIDLTSACSCILGQVYSPVYEDGFDNGFVGGVDLLFGIKWSRVVEDADLEVLVNHGFAVRADADPYQLGLVWKALLQQREERVERAS
jgi:hypothetical protein